MDFRNVTRLFADPDWDGPIMIDPGFTPGGQTTPPTPGPDDPPDPVDPPGLKNPKPIVSRDGCKVEIIHKTVSVYDANGKLLRQESIVDYTKENIRGEYASLDNFIRQWSREEKKEKIFQCDYLKVDWEKHQVSIDGKEVHLTPMEYKILKLLIDNRGKVLTHNYILSQIWGSAQGVEAANLRVFMAALRRKIEKDPGNCRFILTEIGVGYRFREATE